MKNLPNYEIKRVFPAWLLGVKFCQNTKQQDEWIISFHNGIIFGSVNLKTANCIFPDMWSVSTKKINKNFQQKWKTDSSPSPTSGACVCGEVAAASPLAVRSTAPGTKNTFKIYK